MNKKTILSTLGVIVLGAAGSAMWDLLKPVFATAAATLANISTLGLEFLRDDLYARAARTLGRPVGVNTAIQFLACWTALLLAALLHVMSLAREPRSAKYARLYMFTFYAVALALGTQAVRASYALQLANYYEHLEVLAAPFLPDQEVKQYRAAFSQVKTQTDFSKVSEALTSKIRQAGGTPPSPP